MKKDIQKQLDAILEAHAKKVDERAREKAAKESEEGAFIRAFNECCAKVIRPALEDIARGLNSRGVKTRIDHVDTIKGRPHEPSMTLNLLVADERLNQGDQSWPRMRLVCNKYARVVEITFENTPAPPGPTTLSELQAATPGWPTAPMDSGAAGRAKLEGLTEEFIQQRALALMRQVFQF